RRSADLVQLAEVAAGIAVARRLADLRAGDAEPERAHRVGDRKPDVAKQVAVELHQPARLVRILRRLHFLHHPRMAQNRALSEDQQRSEEHTSELQSRENLVCRLLLEKKKTTSSNIQST